MASTTIPQQQLIESLNAAVLKNVLRFEVGDIVNVHFKIAEGEKHRIQIFQGIVISLSGRGINRMVTVRKVVDGVGVERIFPLHSPFVDKYEIVRRADARRAKLYYLRERSGKSQRLRDRRRGMKHNPVPETTTAGAGEADKKA